MKKLTQRLHNMKLSLKLLASYALIVAVAISWPVMIARVKFQMKKKANRPC